MWAVHMASAVAMGDFSCGWEEMSSTSFLWKGLLSLLAHPIHLLKCCSFSAQSHIRSPRAESHFITFSDVPTAAPGETYSILICSAGPLVPGHWHFSWETLSPWDSKFDCNLSWYVTLNLCMRAIPRRKEEAPNMSTEKAPFSLTQLNPFGAQRISPPSPSSACKR